MNKPIEPIEPQVKDYKESGIFNERGFVKDYDKYRNALKKFNTDTETFKQLKLIKLIQRDSEKFCLENFIITKKNNKGNYKK